MQDRPTVAHRSSGGLQALARRCYDWFTDEQPSEPPRLREARLLTLVDTPLVLLLSALWSQAPAWAALIITGERWPIACIVADVLANGWRTLAKRRHVAAVAAHRRSPSARFVVAKVFWLAVLSVNTVAVLRADDVRLAVMASFVPAAFSGYVASRLAAFPRLAMLSLTVLLSGMAVGLLQSPIDGLWMIGLLVPCGLIAFRLLMLQNHAILLSALRAEHENRRLSMHDSLTGLPNRLSLHERLSTLARRSPRPGVDDGYALMCLDLDGFKAVNDRHGHRGGDQVLKSVSERLLACLRGQDVVCRIGGDEFVILLPDADEATAVELAGRLIADVMRPHDLGSAAPVHVGVSVGIAVGSEPGADPDRVLARADQALYDAKRCGKGVWRVARAAVARASG